jgi:hypothetical protein
VTLVVHHRDGCGVLGERAYELSNLEVVCRSCHELEHDRRPRGAGRRS